MSYAMSDWAQQDFGKLFEVDTLMPQQFYAALRKSHHSDPERRLMAAVLEDVVACLSVDPSLCTGRQRRDYLDAEYWLNAPYDSDWIFSFSGVCEALGIDPGYLRKGLNQWMLACRANTRTPPRSRPEGTGVRHKHFRLRA